MTEFPETALVQLPEPYLTAIGRVCVQWSMLEAIAEHSIKNLLGFDLYDYRPTVVTAHMSWPLRMDVLSTLIEQVKDENPHLENFRETKKLLKKANVGRNKVVHANWGYEDGQASIMRASARGKLKAEIEVVSLDEILSISDDIGRASISLYRTVFNV